MKQLFQDWPVRLASVFSVLYLGSAAWLFVTKLSHHMATGEDMDQGVVGLLSLHEWGDYLAGITGPLALIWVIASVFLQGKELREQRSEMSKQAYALNLQAEFIKTELDRNIQERAWLDIKDLLEELRELIPVGPADSPAQDRFYTFTFDSRQFSYRYLPPNSENTATWKTVQFLGRSTGALLQQARKMEEALAMKVEVTCPPSRAKFDRMFAIANMINDLKSKLPAHQVLILNGCRIDEFQHVLKIAMTAFDQSA